MGLRHEQMLLRSFPMMFAGDGSNRSKLQRAFRWTFRKTSLLRREADSLSPVSGGNGNVGSAELL
jgi:hypothetical protein